MKKIIAIMLALAFVLAFSACKKADDDNSGADETSTVSSAEATSIEADSKTQEYIDNFTNSTIENPGRVYRNSRPKCKRFGRTERYGARHRDRKFPHRSSRSDRFL